MSQSIPLVFSTQNVFQGPHPNTRRQAHVTARRLQQNNRRQAAVNAANAAARAPVEEAQLVSACWHSDTALLHSAQSP